jgi:general secretion pathway protein A
MQSLSYWNLKHKPFEGNTHIKFFFASREHGEALGRLRYLVEDRNMGIGVLTGEIGCGKTITRTVLEKMLDMTRFEVVSLDSSDLPFVHLLAEFIDQIDGGGLSLAGLSKFELLFRFRKTIWDKIVSQGKHLVVILDEVHQMETRVLDELKNLTNLSSGEENYLTLILVGQPELRDILNDMPQVDQRVSLRFHLNFLKCEEVKAYIEHRLKAGGNPSPGRVFDRDAIELIYRESQGIPRKINRICKLALDQGFSLQVDQIGEKIASGIIQDLNRQKGSNRKTARWMKISA